VVGRGGQVEGRDGGRAGGGGRGGGGVDVMENKGARRGGEKGSDLEERGVGGLR